MRTYKYEFKRFWFYDLVKLLTWPTWLLWLRPKKHFINDEARRAYKKLAFSGGVLVASNHESFMDSVYLQVSLFLRHHIILSAKDVLDNMKAKKLIRLFGAMEINRENPSTKDFRSIVGALKRGYVVNIFPEGKVTDGEAFSEIKEGVILMASGSGVPILPCYFEKKCRLHLYYGEPIYFDKAGFDKEARKDAAELLRKRLIELKEKSDML